MSKDPYQQEDDLGRGIVMGLALTALFILVLYFIIRTA